MFDWDIFNCLGSRQENMSLFGRQMSNQHIEQHPLPIDSLPPYKIIQEQNNNPEEQQCHEMAFAEINFFPSSQQSASEKVFPCDYSELTQKLEYSGDTKSTLLVKKETSSKLSNNTNDYILKHCLRKMVSQQYKDLISNFCEELKVSDEDFYDYWKQKMEELMPKHIGINRYQKMIKVRSPFMEIFKYFLIRYLQYDYLLYLIQSSIENKPAYIDCAIKLVYIAQVSKKKAYQLIQQAQIELSH